MNKYLSENSLTWLLEDSDPSIKYLTLRDILSSTRAENEYEKILCTREIRAMMKSGKNSILGSGKNFDVLYSGAMWCFCEAVERGLDKRSPVLVRTADFIASAAQMPSGGFAINWKPKIELSCRTGDMVRRFIKAGFTDERVTKGIEWILEHQRHDGGWLHCPISDSGDMIKLMLFRKPGKGLDREGDKRVTSCFYATISCAMALLEHRGTEEKVTRGIDRAAEFFLRHRLFLNSRNEIIRSKKQWNRDFRLLGYPVQSQYDILLGMIFIARSGLFNDDRTGKAFNLIMEKQNSDGTWNLENAQSGMMYGNCSRGILGRKNKWVTLNALRLLKYTGTLETPF